MWAIYKAPIFICIVFIVLTVNHFDRLYSFSAEFEVKN